MKRTVFAGAVLIVFFVYTYFIREVPGPTNPVLRGTTMGTTYEVKIAGAHLSHIELGRLQARMDACLEEINRMMSTWSADSEISAFNANLSTEAVQVSAPFATVVAFALQVSEASEGAFDPTLGPLIDAWGFGRNPMELPSPEVIKQAMARCGFRQVEVVSPTALRKSLPGLQLNLSAIAKGFGVDEVSALLLQEGLTNTYVEIGGEIMVRGRNPDGGPWRLGIDAPRTERAPGEELMSVVALSDRAIATSGDYRNFRVAEDGTRRSHILDPRTGYPITNAVASVSAVAASCMEADAIATALMVLGPDSGIPWIETLPDVEALFLLRDGEAGITQRKTSRFPTTTN